MSTVFTGDINFIGNQQNGGSFIGWGVGLNSGNGKVQFFLYNGTSVAVALPSAYQDGLWHHIVFTYDGLLLAAGCHGYVDGTEQTLTVLSNNLSGSTSNTENIQFSGRGNGAANNWNSTLDSVRIYNRALRYSEVRRLYSEPFAGIVSPRRRIISQVGAAAAVRLLLRRRRMAI